MDGITKLKIGLLMRAFRKETSEPENIAVDQVSKELRFLQRQNEYAVEIERVFKELHLTLSFVIDLKSWQESKVEGVPKEDILLYYQGNFLTLIHQLKDKILQLINLITENAIPQKPADENDIKLKNLLDKKGEIIDKLGIKSELQQWDQQNKESLIAKALAKRTTHCHRVSKMRYREDYQKLGFARIMGNPAFRQGLTDYGKQQIEKIKKENSERLFSDVELNIKETLLAIEENISKISEALISYFNLPFLEEEIKKIYEAYNKMLESFNVTNRASLDKVSDFHREKLLKLVKIIKDNFRDELCSIYLVGSLGRGEYEEGCSDINLYIVVKDGCESRFAVLPETIPYKRELSLEIFGKTEFLSKEKQRHRFIIYADGVLIYGDDLLRGEKFPKAGLFVALLLNDDILEILDHATQWSKDHRDASPLEISQKSKILAKHIIDFVYGVVISNKPQFTSSRGERVLKINEMYPDGSEVIETLFAVSKYGVGDWESFDNLIKGFREKAEINLERMRALEYTRK